jgi:redox-sensitive bicupin YhaK (pirin superfamily)
MKERTVSEVIVPLATRDGAGVQLRRSIATPTLDHLDPFFLFDHFGSENPNDYVAGFPMHPHRGIETITYVLDGDVSHRDSIGNSGVIGAGDVQWMTAGRGILHEEMPHVGPKRLDGFQVWVNLPRELKMTAPRYQDVPSAKIPEVGLAGGGKARVIAGRVGGASGAVRDIYADPVYLDVVLAAGETFEQAIPAGHTGILYVYRGEVSVGGKRFGNGAVVPSPRLAVLSDGDVVQVHAGAGPARFLLLSAQPLGEPAVRYGPFVMNTEDEIEQALDELRNGTFIQP